MGINLLSSEGGGYNLFIVRLVASLNWPKGRERLHRAGLRGLSGAVNGAWQVADADQGSGVVDSASKEGKRDQRWSMARNF